MRNDTILSFATIICRVDENPTMYREGKDLMAKANVSVRCDEGSYANLCVYGRNYQAQEMNLICRRGNLVIMECHFGLYGGKTCVIVDECDLLRRYEKPVSDARKTIRLHEQILKNELED